MLRKSLLKIIYVVIRRASNFQTHDRFQKLRNGISESLLERVFGSPSESHTGRIDRMGLTISQSISNINDGITSQRTLFTTIMESSFNSRDIFVRNASTDNFVDEEILEITSFLFKS